MVRTKIWFGHKQLAGGVVRDRRHEAGGQGFERWWRVKLVFFTQKILWLVTCNARLSSGASPRTRQKNSLFFSMFFWVSWKSHHCRFFITGSDEPPSSLPVYHYRFKIRQWRGFLNRQWCFWGSVANAYFSFNSGICVKFRNIYSSLHGYWVISHNRLYWYVDIYLRDTLVYFYKSKWE